MSTIYVLPVNDLKEHSETDDCECHPRIEYVGEGGKVVVHNSYDGREFYERWEDQKQQFIQ